MGHIHNYILAAISEFNLYGIGYAEKSLQKAVDIAVKDEIIMPFVEYYPYIYQILNSDKLKLPQKYRRKILQLSTDSADQMVEIEQKKLLTSREIEIMQCMEQGMNNAEIAETLFISLNTVKRHIQNIYSKLDVSNKTMALARFREMQKNW